MIITEKRYVMATKTQINAFLKMIVPIAVRQCKKHDNKIYASVCIAQACHESGYGTSAKMVKANALYGVKVGKSAYKYGSAWKGAAYKTGTTEYYDGKTATKITDYFRQYDSIEDATEDYLDLLCTASRYKGALNQPTAQKCIEGIIKGGYATGPQYVSHIMAVIDKYDLTRYDIGLTEWIPNAGSRATIKKGSRGEDVKYLQTRLNALGYDVGANDEIFGEKTKAGVIRFQSDHSLTADGIVGSKTWNAIE